jgi:hypothetical protein
VNRVMNTGFFKRREISFTMALVISNVYVFRKKNFWLLY